MGTPQMVISSIFSRKISLLRLTPLRPITDVLIAIFLAKLAGDRANTKTRSKLMTMVKRETRKDAEPVQPPSTS